MREIGGYLEFENLICKPYYHEQVEINSGRNALLYVLKAKHIKKIYIPKFLCDSVSIMLDKNGYQYSYYNIDDDFRPIFSSYLSKSEYILIINYYGLISNEEIKNSKLKHKNIIVDNTQAFFQNPIEEIDTFYSLRKFFGVPDGAYLFTDTKINGELDFDYSRDRFTHLLGRYEENASKYFDSFKKNDKQFTVLPLRYMSKLTSNILGAINYDKVGKIRTKNFKLYHEKLSKINKLKIPYINNAYSYPLLIENGEEIRKKLIEKMIYIPVLWPNVLRDCDKNSVEYNYAINILPLPCDQRYGFDDINYIVDLLLDLISF